MNDNATERMPLFDHLSGRRETIAARWQSALARTGFAPHSAAAVRRQLLALTDRAIAALLAEPLARDEARAIGAGVARLHYLESEALEQTYAVLAEQLVAGLSVERIGALRPRLVALLGEVSAGYLGQAQETILAEQEVANAALFAALRRAREALRASEARFRALIDAAAIGIALADMDGRLLLTNRALRAMLGYREDELRGRSFTEFAHPDVAAEWELFQELVAGRRERYQLVERFYRRDGAVIWGQMTVSLLRDTAGDPQFAIGMGEDITARKRAEADLDEARRRLAGAREAERLRLARDLHDDAMQHLFGLRFVLLADTERPPDALPLTVDTVAEEIMTVAVRLREIIGELRPSGLDDLGLTAVLAGYVDRLRSAAAAAGVEIALDLDPTGTALPRPVALCLFRVAQEALRNALATPGRGASPCARA